MPRDDVLNLRVPHDLKVALRKAASQDERSMSTLAARIMREWLTAKGYYLPDHAKAAHAPGRIRR